MSDERRHHDPYGGMTDAELDAHFAALFEQSERMLSITLRMPEELLRRTKRVAEERHLPYQRLIKQILDSALTRLERSA